MLSDEERELLSHHISLEEPFGPINAAQVQDPKTYELLFDTHNKLYKGLNQRPSIVVGRKGAGKTSYLNSVYFDNRYDYVVKLDTAEQLITVMEAVQTASTPASFPEAIASIWERILQIAVFSAVRHELPSKLRLRSLINDYLAKNGIDQDESVDGILWHIANTLAEKSKGPVGIVAEILRRVSSAEYSELVRGLNEYLKDSDERAVIVMDSLDDFQLENFEVQRALQGLLKCIGRSNRPRARLDIRFCLPAELFHKFRRISSNPNKDFQRELTLHWIAPELRILVAHRILLYYQLFEPEQYEALGDVDATRRSGARTIWSTVFPPVVRGKNCDRDESALSYIFRHTQLLPRHVLILLNSIAQASRRRDGNGSLHFDAESVVQGVRNVEHNVVAEIFTAYRAVHPNAEAVCRRCIPELNHVFSVGDFERVFRRHGVKVLGSDEFEDFRRTLVEIGAIGKLMDETDSYYQGQFEYTVPSELVFSTDDLYCVHPLFSHIFSVKKRENKPVYPYGTNADDPDYRDWD